ncbi:MAG: hypothetical protein U0M50_08945, partial [Paramuribaculum sp.]
MKTRQLFTPQTLGRMLILAALAMPFFANTQNVIFPQLDQPGIASAASEDNAILLSNDILTASFINDNGHLRFGGCPEMGLKAGTELFTITLGDETTVVPASEMTVTSWGLVPLTGDSNATVASEKLNGQSLVATLTFGDLEFEWKAILRDGSHYIRTVLTLTAKADVAMHCIVPMSYEMNASDAPEVVGNTRGAVLASSKIFAGLETPTGVNSVETPVTADDIVVADNGFS